MPAAYEQLRPRGDARNNRQNMAELKLRRLNELNARLKEDLERPRVKVTEASMSLINYCNNTRDFMVPSVWGQVTASLPSNSQDNFKTICNPNTLLLPRSTNEKIHTPHNNPAAAV
ncbi:hypothetical protein PRK78_004195 [Emydomyces testavorans]|uniref:Guanine nucleotide-binding protein subunit gamma n=1 Tax=Emydomyces testavorans TaxID=2070801 RepID=A0AAF0DHM8_9EURO|nr:hypothetical protein PRK78_004195 [Emydomyces testavorans]